MSQDDDIVMTPLPVEDGPATSVVDPDVVREVADAIEGSDHARLSALVEEMSAPDMADVFEQLPNKARVQLIESLGDDLDPDILTELDETVRDEVIDALEPHQVAAVVSELDTDDAVYLLEDLDEKDRREILDSLPPPDRADVEVGLSYPEDSAGRLMQRDYIAVPMYWTVGQTIDYMREAQDLPDEFYELFVVDPRNRPVGTIRLNKLLRSQRPIRIRSLVEEDLHLIPGDMDQEEVALVFNKYNLVTAPVVDDAGRLLGAIMVDDIVEVIQEEAEEDIMLLGGISEGGVNERTLTTTRTRFTWLLVNLGTAILASLVIGLFDATIEQMVALAILMPIVASMGGNAGTQTLTVAVRALGTKELLPSNALRTVWREALVGSINGVLFALIMGSLAWLWFGDVLLGAIIGIAMVVNLIVAALSGILVPLTLSRMGLDPAVSSTVFVTTVTDVVGFFAFLGLAAWLLL